MAIMSLPSLNVLEWVKPTAYDDAFYPIDLSPSIRELPGPG
jgi:hypothetical protein